MVNLVIRFYRSLPKSIKRRLIPLYKYLPTSNDIIIKNIDGIRFELDLSRMTFAKLYYYGVYEPGTTKVIKEFVKTGMICFDIGASSGVHALRMAKQAGSEGKVYAFEPSDWMLEKMNRNLELNSPSILLTAW